MAKQSKTLNRFDSGIVQGPNPRDIADEASVSIENLDPTTIGGMRPQGGHTPAENPSLSQEGYITNNPKGWLMNQIPMGDKMKGFGYGLFQFSSDYPNLWLTPGTKELDINGEPQSISAALDEPRRLFNGSGSSASTM